MQCNASYTRFIFGRFFICAIIWYAFLYALLFAQKFYSCKKSGCYTAPLLPSIRAPSRSTPITAAELRSPPSLVRLTASPSEVSPPLGSPRCPLASRASAASHRALEWQLGQAPVNSGRRPLWGPRWTRGPTTLMRSTDRGLGPPFFFLKINQNPINPELLHRAPWVFHKLEFSP
jgi:hypothetical protein